MKEHPAIEFKIESFTATQKYDIKVTQKILLLK